MNNTQIKQSTGYKDKNGIEIYVGDILRNDSLGFGLWEIICNRKNEFMIKELSPDIPFTFFDRRIIPPITHSYHLSAYSESGSLLPKDKIVGNITDNPELIKEDRLIHERRNFSGFIDNYVRDRVKCLIDEGITIEEGLPMLVKVLFDSAHNFESAIHHE